MSDQHGREDWEIVSPLTCRTAPGGDDEQLNVRTRSEQPQQFHAGISGCATMPALIIADFPAGLNT